MLAQTIGLLFVLPTLSFNIFSAKPKQITNKNFEQKFSVQQHAENLTIKNFLSTAVQTLGKVLYVYGGGWEKSADTIGFSPEWTKFFDEKAEPNYNFELYDYQDEKGLDCTGYAGWSVFNFIRPVSKSNIFVIYSGDFANRFSNYTLDSKYLVSVTDRKEIKKFLPGSIMASSTEHHVYIVIGQCDDGSVVILHSSPPGVRLCGTTDRNGNKNSQALKIAEKYMCKYCRDFYNKFPDCSKPVEYLTEYEQLSWNTDVVSDPDNYLTKSPDEILDDLFSS